MAGGAFPILAVVLLLFPLKTAVSSGAKLTFCVFMNIYILAFIAGFKDAR